MASQQGDVMVGNVAKLVDRLSKVDVAKPIPEAPKIRHMQIASYAYAAQQADELNLEVDDVIEVLAKIEEGWNKGRLQKNGRVGMYPTNYCEEYKPKGIGSIKGGGKTTEAQARNTMAAADEQPEAMRRLSSVESASPVRPPLSTTFPASVAPKEEEAKDYARITFVYEAQHEDELSLNPVGALVLVTRKETGDPGWFEGECNGKRGLFPDNFVELVRPPLPTSNASPSSGKLNEKPPASLPGAMAVLPPLPPQVPAKPPKNILSVSTTSLNSSTSAAGSTGSVGGRPLTALIHNNNKETTPSTTFSVRKKALLDNLNMHTPSTGPPPRLAAQPLPSSEPAGPSLSAEAPQPLLTHITKDRPRGPTRRPVSMFPKSTTASQMLDGVMSQSEMISGGEGGGGEGGGASSSSAAIASPSIGRPSLIAKEAPVMPSIQAPLPSMTGVSARSGEGQWVTRREHNEVLAKLARVEERLAALEAAAHGSR